MMRDTAALDGLSFADLCARLQLSAAEDGTWRHALADENDTSGTGGMLIALPVGEIVPWQRCPTARGLLHIAGAPMALSLSPDGHSAEAHHLTANAEFTIAAHCWHTIESFGNWSLFEVTGGDSELAPADWFPTPMGHPQGLA